MRIIKILFLTIISVSFNYGGQDDQLLIDIIRRGRVDAAKKILLNSNCKIDLNAKCTYYGSTALIIASGQGFDSIVELLLKMNAGVNIQDNFGYTALILASQRGRVEVVKLLLDYGADINIQTKDGRTALFLASSMRAYEGRKEVIELLLMFQKEYLPFRNKKIEELNKELTNVLRTSSFPEDLIGIVKDYSLNGVITFSQFIEQKEKKNASKKSVLQGCACIIQ